MLGFTFPGQGSQRAGMGRPWTDHPSWEIVEEATSVAGRDVAHLLLDADDATLTRTDNAQLATFVLSLVVLDAVERVGLSPAVVAGHSLGEYTALAAAGVLSVPDGVRLVLERGDAMADAAARRPGAMAAVLGLDAGAVAEACRECGDTAWVANDNAPGQVVVAGTPEGLEAAAAAARARGAKKVLALPVGGAFHTPLMAPARERLARALLGVELRDPEVPVVANVDATAHTDASGWHERLAAQLTSPVRWRESLAELMASGATTLIELGPGAVLTGLAKRGAPGATALSVATPADLETLIASLGPDGGRPSPIDLTAGGDNPTLDERLIVSPAAGTFEPVGSIRHVHPGPGSPCRNVTIRVGSVLGRVAGEEVRSPFAGTLMGMLALDGERVTPTQPIAWLRTR